MVETTTKIKFSQDEEIFYPEQNIKRSFKTEVVDINKENYLVFQIIHSFLFYSFTSEEFIKLYNKDLIYNNSSELIRKINEIVEKIKKNIIIQCDPLFKLNSDKSESLERLSKIIQLSHLKIERDKIQDDKYRVINRRL